MTSLEHNKPATEDATHTSVDARVETLLDRTEVLINAAIGQNTASGCDETLLTPMVEMLSALRAEVVAQGRQLEEMSERSHAMARAQAEAIVHSAEIIDELELTRQRLSNARAAAEQAAQDTQRLADTIFERTHDAVLVFNQQVCIACNDNAIRLLDCQRQSIIGEWPNMLMTATNDAGECQDQELKHLCARAAELGLTSIEVRLWKRAEYSFWAEVTMSAFDMQDSGHVLMVVRDITARKQFESELRRHRDFLNNIINAVPDQISVKAPDRSLVVANDAFCRAHGIGRDAIVGLELDAILPPTLAQHLGAIEDELLATGHCKTTEHEVNLPDGARAIVSVKRSLFEDGTSGERYIVSTSRDITEDRLREDQLRLLASVFNGASEGVAILSNDGRIREANPAFLAMSEPGGRSPIGRHLTDALQFDIGAIDDVLGQVAGGYSWSGKAGIHGNEGDRSYWVSLSPSSDSDEQPSRIIALVSDITELESTQAKLRQQALFDNLTGLPNRRFYRDHLQRLIVEGTANGYGVTVCFIDLDDFKHVNDSAGHSSGDCLLQAIGHRLQEVLGPDVCVARFGGDEFALLLSDRHHPFDQLTYVLEDLLVSFREPFDLHDTEALIGLSIGVTRFPDHASDADTLMSNADIAMYAAKSAGKNRVRVFTPEMQDGVTMRHQVQTKLRRALADGDIRLWFQPKVCARTKMSVGCEALVRWQTKEGKFIPPSEFIPVAEQTGLIVMLGELVFQLAAEQACEWARQGIDPYIAVNISPHQLRHPRFTDQLQATLDSTGARAEWFELEITEHAMMDDVDHAIQVIEELAFLGFHVAIDDFGTGYSSLSYLKCFKIHTLKIDLSFVRDVTHDRPSTAIVRSIVSLGAGLGLTVVAEGVETPEQATLLAELGCNVLQGYHIGKPMAPDNYVKWLESHEQATCPVGAPRN